MKNVLLLLLSTIVSLEAISFVGSQTGLLLFHDTPEFYWRHPARSGNAWRTQRDPWGAWHKPNATERHTSRCFDVVYQSNSFGARDSEFSRDKADQRLRYILLGDSFAEGYGVQVEHTTQHHLEKMLGIDIYNFGVAGFAGPLNHYLLYKSLAGAFEHDGVILYFLPANDFTDSDYELWKDFAPSWLRPYYRKGESGEFEIFYSPVAKPADDYEFKTTAPTSINGLLTKYTWTSNLLRTIKFLAEDRLLHRNRLVVQELSYSGYFSATIEQQEAAVYFIEKIVREARHRRVIIVIIPDQSDMKRIRAGESYATQHWHQKLASLGGRHANVDIIDLAEHMPSDYDRLFLSCDHHWNEAGHLLAANVIADRLRPPRASDENAHSNARRNTMR